MPQKQNISVEAKVKIVREYIGGKIGLSEAARQCNTVTARIVEWAAKYEAEGAEAFLPRNNRGYSLDDKLKAVKEYLSGAATQIEICKKYKIRSTSRLREWIKVYNDGGDLDTVKHSGGGSYMKQGRSTTKEERIRIAEECIATGKNYGAVALKYQVSYQQARAWTLRFEKLGEAGLEDRRGKRKKDQAPRTELEQAQVEIEQLKHKLYLAEMERDLLKKLDEIERRDAYRK